MRPPRGGGISRVTGSYTLTNTILADNSSSVSSPDCEGTIAVAKFSLIENMAGCTITSGNNNIHVDPQLDSAWTGSMSVHLPLSNSPVINNGTSTGCPSTDQIGTTRPYSTSCDIGAVEYVAPSILPLIPQRILLPHRRVATLSIFPSRVARRLQEFPLLMKISCASTARRGACSSMVRMSA